MEIFFFFFFLIRFGSDDISNFISFCFSRSRIYLNYIVSKMDGKQSFFFPFFIFSLPPLLSPLHIVNRRYVVETCFSRDPFILFLIPRSVDDIC